ncbi:MAG: apolipoprotein N-acyltransferase [Thermodesulfovibrionales bacterium]|nr:apolipoprotein N-acyltransferase [Thermodesulfovibrionales bacterium]
MKTSFIKLLFYYSPATISGLLLFFSFPEMDIFPLAWIALIPLLIFLYDKDTKTSFKAGFFFGCVYFFSTTYWIYHSINKYGSIPFIPSLFLVLLLSLYLSLYPALFSSLYSSILKRSTLPAMFVAPVLWTTLEFVRSYALTGFPWSSLGYSQYKFLPFIQGADITGIYGISFILVAVNGAFADMFLLSRRKEKRPLFPLIPTVSGFVILFILLIATFSYGFYRLNEIREGTHIKAAVVQGNIEQDKKWVPSYQDEVVKIYKELSISASLQKPNIIVWPETAVPFYFGADNARSNEVISFQRGLNSYLLFGSVLFKEGNLFTNSAVFLNKDGNISYLHDKIHLVPFGEYVPLKGILFFVDKLVVGVGDYVPGKDYIRAVTPFGSFGTLICYEIIFPGLVRKFYTRGGDFIVTITNDAWFGKTHGPYQHFSMSVFRAVENRKPVIRAANTGISGFIDSNGRIMGRTNLFERTFLVKEVKTDKTLSFYTKFGDIFSYFCIVTAILLSIKKK